MRAQLVDLMVSLGLIKSALDLYLQIHKWDSVISCYTTLDLNHKAADVICEQLKKKETVELYCLLGDSLNETEWYDKAWSLSNERSGRAQRHLGCHYLAKKQYEAAIPHLEKSLSINMLQENLWLRLGYATLTLELDGNWLQRRIDTTPTSNRAATKAGTIWPKRTSIWAINGGSIKFSPKRCAAITKTGKCGKIFSSFRLTLAISKTYLTPTND